MWGAVEMSSQLNSSELRPRERSCFESTGLPWRTCAGGHSLCWDKLTHGACEGGSLVRIGIAADHGGFAMKERMKVALKSAGHDVIDFGALLLDPDDDYPDFVI